MAKYFRFKHDQYDIKLEMVKELDRYGNPQFIPVAGLNDYSKKWFRNNKISMEPSSAWKDLQPFKEATKHSYVCKRPCNSPGDKVS